MKKLYSNYCPECGVYVFTEEKKTPEEKFRCHYCENENENKETNDEK